MVRELAKKIVSGDSSVKKEITERKPSNIINVGSKRVEKTKRNIQRVQPPPKKSKGMLTFEEDSDSDHL